MRIICDIDGTICTHEDDYADARPERGAIAILNELFDAGHEIILWTARGSLSGHNWEDVTRWQLAKWGVKYHELRMGKPYYDLWIDDRSVPSLSRLDTTTYAARLLRTIHDIGEMCSTPME